MDILNAQYDNHPDDHPKFLNSENNKTSSDESFFFNKAKLIKKPKLEKIPTPSTNQLFTKPKDSVLIPPVPFPSSSKFPHGTSNDVIFSEKPSNLNSFILLRPRPQILLRKLMKKAAIKNKRLKYCKCLNCLILVEKNS